MGSAAGACRAWQRARLCRVRGDLTILRPLDAGKASGVLWYEVPNRGNSPLFPALRRLRWQRVMVSSGWQGDLPPRTGLETIEVPVAHNPNGSSITGLVPARLNNLPAGSKTASLEGGFAGLHDQRPANLESARALLTMQASDDGWKVVIHPAEWGVASCERKPFPGERDLTRLCLKGGFQTDLLYELTYTAKDPLVLGIGLAATRDLVSFLRYGSGAQNPVAGIVKHTAGFGTSQSGNFIKTFLHLGFNLGCEGHRAAKLVPNPAGAGGYSPFARTKARREAAGDRRLSLGQRYCTHDGYVAKVGEAARRMVEALFLLAVDADRMVREARRARYFAEGVET